jgi:hypothetical protein
MQTNYSTSAHTSGINNCFTVYAPVRKTTLLPRLWKQNWNKAFGFLS